MNIGERITEVRKRRGMSGSELARRAGISRSQVHLIETGKSSPTADTIAGIARALEVAPGDLFESPKARGPHQWLAEQGVGDIESYEDALAGWDVLVSAILNEEIDKALAQDVWGYLLDQKPVSEPRPKEKIPPPAKGKARS